jgi:hypothetical protein
VAVLDVFKTVETNAPAGPVASMTFVCDFNDVDAEGQVTGEPDGFATPRLRLGQVVSLSDGEHFCEGVLTRIRPDFIQARPDWSTWQSGFDRVVIEEYPTVSWGLVTSPSSA